MERACVVLPTYNEAPNLRVLLPRILEAAASATRFDVHVLVVDDASPDGTADVVRAAMAGEPRVHLLSGRKQGLGVAYRRGFGHAVSALGAAVVVQMDADLQHPPQLLPLLLDLAGRGFGVVIGSRFAPGGATPSFPWRRRLLSRVGNALIRTLGGLPRLHDCTSGFRAIRAEPLRRCDFSLLSTRGYAFQTSLLAELLRNGARPIEVPMIFGERAHGRSKLTLRDQLEFAGNLLRLRLRRVLAWARRALARARGALGGAAGARALPGAPRRRTAVPAGAEAPRALAPPPASPALPAATEVAP